MPVGLFTSRQRSNQRDNPTVDLLVDVTGDLLGLPTNANAPIEEPGPLAVAEARLLGMASQIFDQHQQARAKQSGALVSDVSTADP